MRRSPPDNPLKSEIAPFPPLESAAGGRGDAPIVLLHGLLESPAIWEPQRRALETAGFESLALPLPGHRPDAVRGASARAIIAAEHGLTRHIAERIELRTGGRPVRLVGHSLGGHLALCIARERPDLVQEVMALGALHSGACGRTETLASWLVTKAPAIGPPTARWLLARWVSCPTRFEAWMRPSLAKGERLRAPTAKMRRDLATGDTDTMRALVDWVSHRDALSEIKKVECPVTCVIGARDPVVTADHQLALLCALRRGVGTLIDSGHLPMLTAPDLVARTLVAWARAGVPGADRQSKARASARSTLAPRAVHPAHVAELPNAAAAVTPLPRAADCEEAAP